MKEKEAVMDNEEKILQILTRLEGVYGDPSCALDYGTPFQLLVAVILSAQCTDKRVNIVTAQLFETAKTPEQFAAMDYDELCRRIYSCGFYRNKAKNIISASRDICEKYGGEVPRAVSQLMTLAGVGEKTANVVYAVAFGGQAIPVDTHVGRLSRRLGLSKNKDPGKVMRDLLAVCPPERRTLLHHLLIAHGRNVCKSARPLCQNCPLAELCDYFDGGSTTQPQHSVG